MAQKEVDIFGSFYEMEETCNYTMIVREYCIKPILGRIAFVEHDDHMHIVFSSSPSNSTRRAKRILEHIYMNGRGKVVRTCTFYDNVYTSDTLAWPDCSTLPSENRRRHDAEAEVSKKRARIEKTYDLARTLLDRRITHPSQNTGKSLMCKILTEFLLTGTISRRSENSNFAFENLLDRSVAILEEPKINSANANDMKQLLGGKAFEVAVKYKPMQYLTRLPVIITSNEYLGCRLPDVDAAALGSRYYQFTFSTQIASSTVDGEMDAAPCKICCCHWAEYCKYVKGQSHADSENVAP
ncbi:hypothetical protein ACTXT7_016404 [Hymenolepis weldensis]